MPRRKISRVRNRSEVGSKNPHGWIAFEKGRGTRTIDERGKEKDARLLKSPFMVLESSLESQSTFVFDSLFAILHLRQYSLLQFAPSTICFVENSPSIGSLSLCSTNNRLLIRRSSLAKAFVEISTEGRYRFNRYRYRPPLLLSYLEKHLENEHENNWEEDDPRRWNGTGGVFGWSGTRVNNNERIHKRGRDRDNAMEGNCILFIMRIRRFFRVKKAPSSRMHLGHV